MAPPNAGPPFPTASAVQVETRLFLALCALVALGIFAVDLLSPLGVAGGVPYVALVLLGLWLPWRRAAFTLAGIATALIVAGYFLSPPPNGEHWVIVTNRVLAIAAVWATAALSFLHAESGHRLLENEARLRAVTDTVIDAIIVIDAGGMIRMVNAACEKLFGYAPGELMSRNISMLMPSPDRERHDGYLRRYLETGEKHIIGIGREVTAQRRDGSLFPVRIAVGEAELSGQRIFTGVIHDLTARKEAERRAQELQSDLYRVSRLGEMGEMAAAIAHEVNQPLTAAGNYIGAARRELRRSGAAVPGKIDELMEKAVRQTLRASDVIRQIRALAGAGTARHAVEDLNAVIQEAVALALIGTREKGIRVSVALAEGLPPCRMNRTQIQQVLINLLRNSIDAMDGCEQRELAVRSALDDGARVEVAVEDTGCGLPPEVQEHLFKPFITTKPHGMGIGLSISHSIISDHGGRLWAAPRDGGGTVFRFFLPAEPS